MMNFQGYKPQERMSEALFSSIRRIRVMKIRSEERRDVGPGLRYNEVIDVEQLRNPRQWRLAVVIASLSP